MSRRFRLCFACCLLLVLAAPAHADEPAPKRLPSLGIDRRLPPGAVLRLSGTRYYAAAFTPDGKHLVTGGDHPRVAVWDLTSDQPAHAWEIDDAVRSLSVSPDGKTLAAADVDGRVHAWALPAGEDHDVLEGQIDPAETLRYSPDGKRLVTGNRRGTLSVRRNDHPRCSPDALRSTKADRIYSLAFTPDSELMACGDDLGTIHLWDLVEKKELDRHRRHRGHLTALAFSPDGKLLASGDDGEECGIRLWNTATAKAKEVRFCPAHRDKGPNSHRNGVLSLAFSPDGECLASTGGDETVRLWDVSTGKELSCWLGHDAPVYAVAFSPDGRFLATAGEDGGFVWDAALRVRDEKLLPLHVEAADVPALWGDLIGVDVARMHAAAWRLRAAPGPALAILRREALPLAAPEPERLARLIDELDDKRFAVRQAAQKQLEDLGDLAAMALNEALEKQPPLEKQRRLEAILSHVDDRDRSPERMKVRRMIQLLEMIGTEEARRVLETLAKGAPSSRLTQEAKASAERLARKARDED